MRATVLPYLEIAQVGYDGGMPVLHGRAMHLGALEKGQVVVTPEYGGLESSSLGGFEVPSPLGIPSDLGVDQEERQAHPRGTACTTRSVSAQTHLCMRYAAGSC